MKTDNLRTIALSEILALPVHPEAACYPMLEKTVTDESKKTTITLAELSESIRNYRLQKPFVLFNGQLIDGRNRKAACEIAIKVDNISADEFMVPAEDFIGTDEEASEYIRISNARRDMTPGQRAATAILIWDIRAAAAKKRMLATQNNNASSEIAAPSTFTGQVGDTRDILASEYNVSNSYIQDVLKIKRDAEAKEAAAIQAAEEATRQRKIAEVKRAELEAAKKAGETLRLADTATAVNDALQSAIESQEKASQLQEAANNRRNALDKIHAGKMTIPAAKKEVEQPISNDECQEAIGKAKSSIQSAVAKFKESITTLADCSDQDEVEYEFIGGKIQSIIEHFEKEFGVEIE